MPLVLHGETSCIIYIHMHITLQNTLGHSNWIISFPLLDVTNSMRAGGRVIIIILLFT